MRTVILFVSVFLGIAMQKMIDEDASSEEVLLMILVIITFVAVVWDIMEWMSIVLS